MSRQPSPNEGRYKNDSNYVLMMGPDGRMHYYRQADDEVLDAMKGSTQTVMGDMRAMRESQERQVMMDNLIESVQMGIDTFYDLLDEELTFQLNGREISQEEAENHIRSNFQSWPQPWEAVNYDQYGRPIVQKRKEPGLLGSLSLVLKGWLQDKLFGKYVGQNSDNGYIMPPRGAILSGRNLEYPIGNFVNHDPDEMAEEAEEFKKEVEEAEKRDTEKKNSKERSKERPQNSAQKQDGEKQNEQRKNNTSASNSWDVASSVIDSPTKRLDIIQDFEEGQVDMCIKMYEENGLGEPTNEQIDQFVESVSLASHDAMHRGIYQMEMSKFLDDHVAPEKLEKMKDSGEKLPKEVSNYLFKMSVARAMTISEANRSFPGKENSDKREQFFSDNMGKLKKSFVSKEDEERFIEAARSLK